MNAIVIIAKKEIKSFFTSPTYWVICFLISLMLSWVFPIQLNLFSQLLSNYVMQQGVPTAQLNIHYGVFLRELSYLNLMLIFIVPALTMKLFAEEKKMRTFDLLLTSPITSAQIVAGKFISVVVAIFGIIVLAFMYPLATSLLAEVNWVPLVIAFFGLFLVGLVYGAMNLFASSLSENTIAAYIISVIFNLSIWFIGIGSEVVDGERARSFFEHISLSGHLSTLVEGTIRTSGLIFFISVLALFCFLAERVVESSRWR